MAKVLVNRPMARGHAIQFFRKNSVPSLSKEICAKTVIILSYTQLTFITLPSK
jgi:hypothetical protein